MPCTDFSQQTFDLGMAPLKNMDAIEIQGWEKCGEPTEKECRQYGFTYGWREISLSTTGCTSGKNGAVCQNGGTPTGIASCSCICKAGFSGEHCETPTACTTGPNGFACEHGTAGGTPGNCQCTCPAGYSGLYCEVVHDCVSASCQNNGIPIGKTGACGCKCPDGYSGDHCETPTFSVLNNDTRPWDCSQSSGSYHMFTNCQLTSQIDVTQDLEIKGWIDIKDITAAATTRHFNVEANHLTLENVRLIGNGVVTGDGGAIFSNALLTLKSVIFHGNEASNEGGAVATRSGNIIIIDSSFTQNNANNGGALAILECSSNCSSKKNIIRVV